VTSREPGPARPQELLRNFVHGDYVPVQDGRTSDVVDPSTGEAYALAPVSGVADVDAALRAAAAAQPAWRNATPAERSLALLRFADAIEARSEDLVAAESRNTGKPVGMTRSDEVPPLADELRFFAGAARLLEGKSAGEYLTGYTSMIRREPVGVCAQVTPWNYPMMMAVWKFAPAIAAGNTVVLKPSDTTPVSTLLLAEIAAEFLPPGVLNVICGDRDTGRALVAHEIPQMVSITGSVRAGIEVAQAAAPGLKRVHLELGGKAPVIVFDDADAGRTAAQIADAGYYNAGQDCTAATRVLAGPRIADDLTDALVERARAVKTGGLDQPDADYGPLNNPAQLARVEGFLRRAPDHAGVLTGGQRVGERGYCFAPTVVTGLAQHDEMIQDEIFGPVITVQRFSSEAQALSWANGVKYGLAASVWTADHGRAMRMARQLDFGVVWINTHVPFVSEMPHGGFKHSGYGKDLSGYGFDDYTRIKHVMSSLGDG
jgi:betaine-aldehyde dehydrogenase